MTLGLKQAGFRVLAGVELDILATETYKLNHRSVLIRPLDIRKVDPSDLMRRLGLASGDLDLLAGCPPCQGFSSIRTLRRGTVKDERNELVLEFIRFVDAFMPRAVLMENVPGLVDDARFGQVVRKLRRRGYGVVYGVVDAAEYGVPQRRRRLVMIAARGRRLPLVAGEGKRKTVRDAIGQVSIIVPADDPLHSLAKRHGDRVRKLIASIPTDGGSRTSIPIEMRLSCHVRTDGFSDVYGRMRWDEPAPTITGGCVNPSKGRFLHPDENRTITLREAALLQSFPPDYQFSMRRGIYGVAEMIGNALPPELVRHHATTIAEALRTAGQRGSNSAP